MHNNWVWNRANGSVFGVKAAVTSLLREWNEARVQTGVVLDRMQEHILGVSQGRGGSKLTLMLLYSNEGVLEWTV